MASPKLPARLSTLILFLVLAMAELQCVVIAIKLDSDASFISHFPPLLDCAAPAPAPPSKDDASRAYRANVLSVLRALPAAASPTGFAAVRSGGVFARGLCFGFGDCVACLSAAAEDAITGGCVAGSRRAGVWRAGCFLSYADTNASSPREDAFRGWFYDGAGGAAALGCAGDRAAAECSRCLNASALLVPSLKKPRQQPSRTYGDAVVVVGYDCYLRVQIHNLPRETWWNLVSLFIINLFMLCVMTFCTRRIVDLA